MFAVQVLKTKAHYTIIVQKFNSVIFIWHQQIVEYSSSSLGRDEVFSAVLNVRLAVNMIFPCNLEWNMNIDDCNLHVVVSAHSNKLFKLWCVSFNLCLPQTKCDLSSMAIFMPSISVVSYQIKCCFSFAVSRWSLTFWIQIARCGLHMPHTNTVHAMSSHWYVIFWPGRGKATADITMQMELVIR